jgi:polyisoprenoid-binding protein YceI
MSTRLLALTYVALGIVTATPAYGRPLSFDVQQSTMTVHVSKQGAFSFLADNHVVSAPIVSGSYDPNARTIELTVDATKMRVLDPKLSQQRREDVQANMAGPKVLDVAAYPTISFRSAQIDDADPNTWKVTGTLALRGQAHPIAVRVLRKDATHFTGSATIVQSAFGISPIKIAGGAVSVKDAVGVEFAITLSPEPSR